MTILDKIIKNRKKLIKAEKKALPFKDLKSAAEKLLNSGFEPPVFLNAGVVNKPFLVSEIKKSSPSKGLIRENFNLADIVKAYNDSGRVSAISILTEPDFFQGKYEYIEQAKKLTGKPVLMKDFIIDPYQIYKGFMLGASAVLVIASITDNRLLGDLVEIADELNMRILFEVHTLEEYRKAAELEMEIIGINNRDLKSFATDINNSIDIIKKAGKPGGVTVISESGINSIDDIKKLSDNGIDGFLIGERFMREKNISQAINDLFGE